ncbi:sigma-70 family RNA polymerase sigma factor [Streptomyces sp. RS2]|uniref:sigma-70 family RNA polymerase sigma factor n=1 Tax=Streptomyces sp. RS2 TaxID=1451205 RepID=UPI0021F81CE4|nr:sigma-70 family RNA polymerase sigma factor [Streptomyces sp. RS2]MCW1100090.1 sigma-70 family RNA polymerase sigma factor [Streptomyces sp. RS2]
MARHSDSESLLLAQGEQQALGLPREFSQMYEHLQPEFRRWIRQEMDLVRPGVDADDVLYEVWAQVAQAWPAVRANGLPADVYARNIAARTLRAFMRQSPWHGTSGPRAVHQPADAGNQSVAGTQLATLLRLVQNLAAEVLGYGDTDTVEVTCTFRELGYESVTAVELRNRLAASTGLTLAAGVAFTYPTPLSLAQHLLEQLAPAEGQARDPKPGFEEFYNDLQPQLRKQARHLLGPACRHDVDDVLQTVWITVLDHWTRIREMDHARAYVHTITRNEALRIRRAAARRSTLTPSFEDAQLTQLAEVASRTTTDQTDYVLEEEGVQQYIAEHIAPCLSHQQRAILLLETAGYGTDAIAEALAIGEATVRVQRHRTRRKLRAVPRPAF